MPYLDAALAFALTMLAVATLVTQIVRFGQFLAKTRATVMKKMLDDYFTKELVPVINREVERLDSAATKTVTKAVSKAVTTNINTLADNLASNFNVDMIKKDLNFTEDEVKKLVEFSTEELKELIKRSDLGKELLKQLGNEAQTVFDELGNQYDQLGKRVTKSFRENARGWATVIALILAFALNIDTIFIAKTYITNEGMRQAVIAQQGALEEAHTSLKDKLQQEGEKETVTKEELDQVFADTQAQLDTFTSAGFPIGWSYYPYAAIQGEPSKDYDDRDNTPGFVLWIAGCILTGLLAGLGGPFWYDVVAGISKVAKTARGQKN
jgi:hypothetical protein